MSRTKDKTTKSGSVREAKKAKGKHGAKGCMNEEDGEKLNGETHC